MTDDDSKNTPPAPGGEEATIFTPGAGFGDDDRTRFIAPADMPDAAPAAAEPVAPPPPPPAEPAAAAPEPVETSADRKSVV